MPEVVSQVSAPLDLCGRLVIFDQLDEQLTYEQVIATIYNEEDEAR